MRYPLTPPSPKGRGRPCTPPQGRDPILNTVWFNRSKPCPDLLEEQPRGHPISLLSRKKFIHNDSNWLAISAFFTAHPSSRIFRALHWSASLSPKGESAPQRYQYPACTRPPIILYPGCMILSERPRIVPHEVICLYVHKRALSPRVISGAYSMQPGSKASFSFISVHAIMSIFAASFIRIFIRIPFSRSLPLSLRVK